MAHFYGVLQGGRGETTRTGHKTTGIVSTVKTYGQGITVRLWNENGQDHYTIERFKVASGQVIETRTGRLDDSAPEHK